MTTPEGWPPPPARPSLAADEVHLWLANLDEQTPRLRELESTLSPDERARAGRFHFDQDRRRYGIGRALLRSILSRYLPLAPAQFEFSCNAFGKPSLAGDISLDVRFNLAHSGHLALFAITRGRDLGVDLEMIRPDYARERIAEDHFSPAETAKLRALDPALQTRAFFDCWTRKEAYVKARGDGLSRALASFDVAFAPGEPPAILRASDQPDAATRWFVRRVDVAPDFAAALVVEGTKLTVKQWRTEP